MLKSLLADKKGFDGPKANMAGRLPCMIKRGWVINSGANQHYIINEENLEDVVDIAGLKLTVEHPNSTNAKITKQENYRLSSNVVLFDVHVVPEYVVNLLSVYNLARDSKKFVGFDENKCYVQDSPEHNLMEKTLVTGSQCGGLYFFDDYGMGKNNVCNSVFTCCESKFTWHSRL